MYNMFNEVDVDLSFHARELYRELEIVHKLKLNVGKSFKTPETSHDYVSQTQLFWKSRAVYVRILDNLRYAESSSAFGLSDEIPRAILAIEETRRLVKGSGKVYQNLTRYVLSLKRQLSKRKELSDLMAA